MSVEAEGTDKFGIAAHLLSIVKLRLSNYERRLSNYDSQITTVDSRIYDLQITNFENK